MSRFIHGVTRSQITLFPDSLDDFISEENTVRIIDVFVDELDLKHLGFEGATLKSTGRPRYNPSILLKLYLFGYLNRIQSSRRLERECHRNIELMWLTGRLSPDFKTIADFRKDNAIGIKNVCRTFIDLCRKLNMFKDAVLAIDGSKFKACNHKDNNYTPKKLLSNIERVEKHISDYLNKLDTADKADNKQLDEVSINETINKLKQRLVELRVLQKEVDEHPDKQISTTDPDSRLMKMKQSTGICYNVQSAVDVKHHLIVAHEVTNTPDRGRLCEVGKMAQDALGNKNITVIADKGYFSGQDIKDAQDAGMIALVPKGDTSGSEKKGIFNASDFKYQPQNDTYLCPANKELTYRFTGIERGMSLKRYFTDIMTCRACSLKSQCTKSTVQRRIVRWEHQHIIDDMEQRLRDKPDTMLIRKQTVEHPFGTIKCWMGATHFLTRRFKNVRTEMNLHVFAYNFKRMISIMGYQGLISAMKMVL